MSRWRVLLVAVLDDIRRNPAWFALVSYTLASTVAAGIREHERVRAVVNQTREDIESRLGEIAERMTEARQAEHDAVYDHAAWGEDDPATPHEAPTDG